MSNNHNNFSLIDHPSVDGDSSSSQRQTHGYGVSANDNPYSDSHHIVFEDDDSLFGDPVEAPARDANDDDIDDPFRPVNSNFSNGYGYEDDLYDSTGAGATGGVLQASSMIDDQDFLAAGSGGAGGSTSIARNGSRLSKPNRFSSVYSNLKTKIGLQPQYSEMDLPLTEYPPNSMQSSSARRGAQQDSNQATAVAPGGYVEDKDDDNAHDFDIRDIFNTLLRRKKEDPSSSGPRVIHVNGGVSHDHPASISKFKGNHISTTKYNVATFVPKFLFEQFSKYANLFFLCTSCIQQVPNVSPTNRYTTIGTLAVVLMVSAVKELIEDFKRRNADKELNNSKIEVLNTTTGMFEEHRWVKVKVGDIVRVNSEEPFPADILLLASSEPEGLCYIETANLDGETNLKIKQAKGETSDLVSPSQLTNFHCTVLSEQPNSSLYTYEATLEMPNGSKIAVAPDQLLLRGATLRNTPWIHGIVVFTGHETKLMRNATAAPIKRTAVEHMINLQIIFLFSILLILAVTSSLGNVIKLKVAGSSVSYLYMEGTNKVGLFFSDILTYWVLYSNLVPISLFVTVEIIKFYQALLISSDLDMYYKETDTPSICRTSSLVEELGQIEYIFSDKTGTLTRNIMEFKSCSIAGRCYAKEIPEDRRLMEIDGQEVGYRTFDALKEDMDAPQTGQVVQEFFTLLAACHTVIPEVRKDLSIKYQAASPDEGALVEGAAQLGFRFIIRRPKSITIDIRGQEFEYELLNICEFNSTRKRMSAIFRCPDGKIRLYCKGADTVILERLAQDNPFVSDTMAQLEEFASEGLRTLCLAMRVVPEDEYQEWSSIYDSAATTLDDRAQKLDDAADLIEKDLFLLGATAIEDKLQDGVPETIHTLQDAGIKIWVLTGDRQETAVNIGMSCKLLSEDMNLLIVNEETFEDTNANIRSKLDAIRGAQSSRDHPEAFSESMALVIDGKSLGFALDRNVEKQFLDLAVMCKAVICCRVSPLQKALVVKLVKRHLKALLLAVGDGANDVSMIQAAHVGVGISGMEGMQAARSADVSIGQFKYLRKLLLVHGTWSYQRLSKAILYSFYKNIALYMTQFWYVFQNGFSGQSIYESWTITFYNVICTVLPPFVIGIVDQFISARLLDRYPQLYQLGQKGAFLNVRHFWEWVLNGFYHSIILYVGSTYAYRLGNVLPDGQIADHWTWGTAAFTACVLTALGKAALVTSMWNKFALIAMPGSLLCWLGFFPAYATIAPLVNVSDEYRGVLSHLYSSLVFWATLIVLPIMCLVRDFAWKYYKRMYRPEAYHYVQEIQKYNIADYRPRMEQFQKAIRKVRQVQRMRKQRGFAFSQADEGGQARVVRAYDTTQSRGQYGEMKAATDTQSFNEFGM